MPAARIAGVAVLRGFSDRLLTLAAVSVALGIGVLGLDAAEAPAEERPPAKVEFAAPPKAETVGEKVKITFAVSAPTDVEVAVLDAKGTVVRHLAAGLLGQSPPPPLKKDALAQELFWDLKDDLGKAAQGGPFKARVRAGTGVKFGRFIGADPCNFGAFEGLATDEEGNVYLLGFGGEANQGHMVLRVFDPEGRYLRELLPFPADLPPDAMKDIARWDAEKNAFLAQHLKNLNPDFYDGNRHGCLQLISASAKSGVLLTDGNRVCRLDARGAVPEAKFAFAALWPPKGVLPNTGGGPILLAASPDGKFLYLSGPYSSDTAYGHKADPRFPPAQVYRMAIGDGTMQAFARLPTVGQNPAKAGYGWCGPHIAHASHYTIPHGPIHGIAVDREGHVLVADQDGQRVAVFDPVGKQAGEIKVPCPDLVAVHPTTGAVYVLTKEIKGYQRFKKQLVKFSGWKDGRQEALLDLGTDRFSTPRLALSAGKDKTLLWLAGVPGGLVAFEDRGNAFEPVQSHFAASPRLPADWARLATDFARDDVYVSNGTTRLWRFNGLTGEGDLLKKNGKPFLANDLAVGYDGHLYVRVSGEWDGSAAGYSGPFWRLDRDLAPVPYAETGTHVLSPYIYSRYGIGFAERGIGVGPDAKAYVSFMYKWVAYAIGGFGPDGKPLPGKHLKGEFPGKGKYPSELDSAIIGPLPQANGGIRVDLQGNLYVGMLYWPKEVAVPRGREKDRAWTDSVGSVVKFAPEGGSTTPGDSVHFRAGTVEGLVGVYPGLAPFSRAGIGGNTCCVCRTPRFDLDRYGRLILPNAITHSVLLYDNAGNLIVEFGRYGNFDSQFVNPHVEAGKAGRPTIAVPDIPLAWPTGAGFSESHLYIADTYCRRIVRVDPTFAAEATCQVR